MAEINEERSVAEGEWKDLFSRWKIGTATFVVSYLVSAACVLSLTPLYRAQLQILLPANSIEDPADRRHMQVMSADAFVVHSFIDAVKDDGISSQVIDRFQLTNNPEFNKKPGKAAMLLSDLKRRLVLPPDAPPLFNAEQIKRDAVLHDYASRLKAVNDSKSLTLTLSFDASDPFLAKRIVDTQAQFFIESQIERRRSEAAAKVTWMKAELEQAAEEARAAQVAIQLHMPTALVNRDAAAEQVTDLKFRQMVASSKQAVYETMLRRYQDMVAEERYEGSGIRILSLANVPTQPDFPKKALMLTAAAFISSFLGLMMAWIVSVVRRQETPEQILGRLQIDKLGLVNFPKRSHRRWVRRQERLRTTLFWEQIAGVRSTFSLPATSEGRVFAVTSAVAKEGKSLVAAGLARTFACGGSKTLLLDLNLRSPRFFAPAEGGGSLQDLIAGFSSLQHSVVSIDRETPLYMLAPSKGIEIDVLAVTGTKMRAILKQARRQFDVVVIDTPALEIVSDTLLIGALADEVILASLDERLGLSALDDAVRKLRSRAISIKGVVITNSRKPARAVLARMKPYANGSRPHVVWPDETASGVRGLPRSGHKRKVKRIIGEVVHQIESV